jgi:hypothetical protein
VNFYVALNVTSMEQLGTIIYAQQFAKSELRFAVQIAIAVPDLK